MSILTLVPSRGRPDRAKAMSETYFSTMRLLDTGLLFLVDPDDPALPDYKRNVNHFVLPERLGYTASLNYMARAVWDERTILGAFGDDVLFRTDGWDTAIADALQTPGIAYGNDLVHAAGHPTAIFMSSSIARALGWLALPASWHLWVDDAWKRLGQETGTLRYLPDLIFEHMHPAVGKAEMDLTYEEVYDGERGHQDHLGFLAWEQNDLAADAAKVRAVL